ncbi:hypothetical protein E6C50_11675 [Flavobacterium supellecticarium]|uniref:Uncharacterized protein n=1 Tax=Flavobacterium supellecticarium TaxID=2565924 RepID=A0A4S3ZUI6_9FLAO|nr:hypothetical protein [Flavobacterium supellecticarium]THF49404.1 hypothetical protein E6C50_11675 [Flavobacterium supellecticarium]
MKKKLEAELISIAHRILKLKNKSEVIQLHQETQKLYEILSVLRFYEENFEEAKPTIGLPELEEKLEETFENKEPETVAVIEEPKKEEPVVPEKEPEAETIATPEETLEAVITEASVSEEENTAIEEVVSEPEQKEEPEEPVVAEAEKVVVGQIDIDESDLDEEEPLIEEEKAAFPEVAEEPVFEPVKEEPKKEAQQITLEDLLGQHTYKEPEFVKVEDVPAEVEKVADITFEPVFETKVETQSMSIDAEKDAYSRKTDAMGKSISLGLNDRIAFEKNLFGGSGEDLNRVLSQLNSFDNYQDAQNFIEDLVKPDYNNWEGKEEYETRFMEIVEKRFS